MTKPLLFVVDDEPTMAEYVGEIGEMVGFTVRTAKSGREFQELCAEETPSGVVTDIVMPDIDGNEVLEWLAANLSTTPVVVMSGTDHGYVGTAVKLGKLRGANVVGSLEKPFRVAEIEPLLRSMLQQVG
jgi:FixJ family two-component response regulator